MLAYSKQVRFQFGVLTQTGSPLSAVMDEVWYSHVCRARASRPRVKLMRREQLSISVNSCPCHAVVLCMRLLYQEVDVGPVTCCSAGLHVMMPTLLSRSCIGQVDGLSTTKDSVLFTLPRRSLSKCHSMRSAGMQHTLNYCCLYSTTGVSTHAATPTN